MRLLLHPQTEFQITSYLSAPSHALIISGPSGIGKKSTAAMLIDIMLRDFEDSIKNAYTKIIRPVDGKQISIESIRDLEHFLSLKVPSYNAVNRVAIIEDGHLLTSQAQNALLKTLEEPPIGTVIACNYTLKSTAHNYRAARVTTIRGLLCRKKIPDI
jgi:DNA polymerase III delta prime subunit